MGRLILAICLAATVLAGTGAAAGDADSLVRAARAASEAFREQIYRSGIPDAAPLQPVEFRLREALTKPVSGDQRAEVLYQLGSILRLQGRFSEAVVILQDAATAAEAAGRRDLAFDSWIDLARAHLYGSRHHGMAGTAIDRAAEQAGEEPSPRQRFDLALYRAELLESRGEIEAGLVAAADAIASAETGLDRFYSQLDTAQLYRAVLDRCDARPDFEDCNRGAAGAARAYRRAATVAVEYGWLGLLRLVEDFEKTLAEAQRQLEQRAKQARLIADAPVFAPSSLDLVLVNRHFDPEPSGARELLPPELIEQAITDLLKRGGSPADARVLQMAGDALYLRGDRQGAARFYAASVDRLDEERGGFFDLRRRGTVVESRVLFYRRLALQLLALDREEEAFAAFEKARARGLAELASLVDQPEVDDRHRAWLSALLVIEATISAEQRTFALQALEKGELATNSAARDTIEQLERERRKLLLLHPDAVRRFSGAGGATAGLRNLEALARAAEIPVLLYWSDPSNLIVWYVGPRGSDVRAVFFPETVLREKVQRLRESVATPESEFDRKTARELYLYLIAPFADLLDGDQILIVPQADLVSLPFELLVEPERDRFLIERWAVSYAPNATMAAKSLSQASMPPRHVAAIYDPKIEAETNEVEGLAAVLGPQTVDAAAMQDLTAASLRQRIAAADSLHLLAHGAFDANEPLLSELTLELSDQPRHGFTAAELVGLPLRRISLAVLSACESGQTEARISNEIFGFPWSLLVAGVDQVLLSRWRVRADTNRMWMESFYRALGGGASPALSAAAASRAMLREPATAHPYFWAAVQVIGR